MLEYLRILYKKLRGDVKLNGICFIGLNLQGSYLKLFYYSFISPRMSQAYKNNKYTNRKEGFLGLFIIYAQESYHKLFYNSSNSPRVVRVYDNIIYNKKVEFIGLLIIDTQVS